MSRARFLLSCIFLLLPALASASLGDPSPKREVSGRIVEFNRRASIVVLADFQGWDREQGEKAAAGEKAAVKRWLEGLRREHAALYVKADDAKSLRKGMRIRINDYQYAFSSSRNGSGPVSVVPLHGEIEIIDARE